MSTLRYQLLISVHSTNSANNVQTWNQNFTYLGSAGLNLGTGAVTLAGKNRLVTVSGSGSGLTVGGVIGSGTNVTAAPNQGRRDGAVIA